MLMIQTMQTLASNLNLERRVMATVWNDFTSYNDSYWGW